MSEQDVTQESSGWLEAELDAIQPGAVAREPNKTLAQATAALEDMAARETDRQAHDKAVALAGAASIAFQKYHAKFGWTEAQFAEYWPLRGRCRLPGEKQTEWVKLLSREGKTRKAASKPRKNEILKDMTPEARNAHRLKKNRERVARHRAEKAAKAAAKAAADAAVLAISTGQRPMSDEELAAIKSAEASQAPAEAVGIDDMLADLRAAADAEASS